MSPSEICYYSDQLDAVVSGLEHDLERGSMGLSLREAAREHVFNEAELGTLRNIIREIQLELNQFERRCRQ